MKPEWSEPLKQLEDFAAPSPKDQDAFLSSQYGLIKGEVMERLKELWALEKFAFLGSAGIAAWLFANAKQVNTSAPLARWPPLILLTTCLVRFLAGMWHLADRTTKFLIKIEERYLGKEEGWDAWFSQQPANETYAFEWLWVIAILSALALP